jgi:DNA-binding response OmpR family regulator
VARRIRALPEGATVPILVISATADSNAEDLSRQAGARQFLRKPVNIRSLANLLKELIGNK